MTDSTYITTPIYYVNDVPHIGHAYTTLAADTYARYERLKKKDVKFLTGTDEHGQKVDKAAKAKNISAQEFCDNISGSFRNLVNTGQNILNVTNEDFIRTTEDRHKKAAKALWERLVENGHIYLDAYKGWYSVRDEAYYQESELIEGKAPTGAEVEWVEEESYFFDLSKWQKPLLEFYEANPNFVTPVERFNEVKSFVRGGKEFEEGALKDLSISRTTFDWGVEVPNAKNHVMYVWIDALTNYLTAVGYPDTQNTEYKKYWQNSDNGPIHFVGKDIIRFHAVYWPAFLMAANLPLPKKIVAHGWWLIEGEKMSKSLGNVIAPLDLTENYGSDQTRFALLREVSFGNDGNFAKDNVEQRINTELANTIGNLAQRSLSMIYKNCDGKIPSNEKLNEDDKYLLEQIYNIVQKTDKSLDKFRFDLAIEEIISCCYQANEYIDKQAPWKLKKEDFARMEAVLFTLAEFLRNLGIILAPFTPNASKKLLDILNIDSSKRFIENINKDCSVRLSDKINEPEGLFPRIEK